MNPHQAVYAAKRIRQALLQLVKPLQQKELPMSERKLMLENAVKHALTVAKETEWIDSTR